MQLATQCTSNAEDSRTKQHDAAGLRSAVKAEAGPADRERFARNRAYGTFRGQRRAALPTAAHAAILIPVKRLAFGGDRVLQVEPVSGARSHGDVEARHCEHVNVVAIAVGGK